MPAATHCAMRSPSSGRGSAVVMPTRSNPRPRAQALTSSESWGSIKVNLSALHAWVEQVPQAISQQIEAHHREENRQAGIDGEPWSLPQIVASGAEHRAPRGCGRLRAQAKERQAGFGQDRAADAERDQHDA